MEDGKKEGQEVPERYLKADAQFPFVAFYQLPALADVSEFIPEQGTDEGQDAVHVLGRVEIRLSKRPSPESRVPFCGHGGLPEPQIMLHHKSVEELEISGI